MAPSLSRMWRNGAAASQRFLAEQEAQNSLGLHEHNIRRIVRLQSGKEVGREINQRMPEEIQFASGGSWATRSR